jgi:hypothetical protein
LIDLGERGKGKPAEVTDRLMLNLRRVDNTLTEKETLMNKRIILIAATLLAILLVTTNANAQVNDTETFTVTVDPVLTIVAPAASVGITHDATNGNQIFAAQRWLVTQNAAAGAAVTFSTNQAFTNTVSSSFKRDAKLDLAVFSSDSGSGWAVTTATDQTDYANITPDGVATVAAAATAPGDASLDLTVTFITTDFSTLASGAYATTVTGTITAN